ncbi:MAG: N-acetyltransferase [Propionibacteriaceae bacterium]|jgi:predicted GNAT family acetyltransferase|nr:N-acetyltransferase [Propionibacteriaceae bacterium]
MTFRKVEGRFEVIEEGQVAGWLDFASESAEAGAPMVMDHTEVLPEFGGRGLAGGLARYALEYARAEGWTVLPYCSFIRGYIVSHPEFHPLVPAGRRTEFGLPGE